jgi:hypothetical protein
MNRPTPCWTLFRGPRLCGHIDGPHVVPAMTPIRHVAGVIYRCMEHATTPVDWDAVDKIRLQFEAEDAARNAPREPSTPIFHRPVRQPVPLRVVAQNLPFDARKAAAGDR